MSALDADAALEAASGALRLFLTRLAVAEAAPALGEAAEEEEDEEAEAAGEGEGGAGAVAAEGAGTTSESGASSSSYTSNRSGLVSRSSAHNQRDVAQCSSDRCSEVRLTAVRRTNKRKVPDQAIHFCLTRRAVGLRKEERQFERKSGFGGCHIPGDRVVRHFGQVIVLAKCTCKQRNARVICQIRGIKKRGWGEIPLRMYETSISTADAGRWARAKLGLRPSGPCK